MSWACRTHDNIKQYLFDPQILQESWSSAIQSCYSVFQIKEGLSVYTVLFPTVLGITSSTIAMSWACRTHDNIKQYLFDPQILQESWSSGLEACWGADDAQVQYAFLYAVNVLAELVSELLAISDTVISFCFHPWMACDGGLQDISACFCWKSCQASLGIATCSWNQ